MSSEFEYITTDLDLVSNEDLHPLGEALAQRGLYSLHIEQWDDGTWHARFATEAQFDSPEPNVAAILDAVESLDGEPLRLWNACTQQRELNIGVDCGVRPREFAFALPSSLLARLASLGASVGVTLFPIPEDDAVEPPAE